MNVIKYNLFYIHTRANFTLFVYILIFVLSGYISRDIGENMVNITICQNKITTSYRPCYVIICQSRAVFLEICGLQLSEEMIQEILLNF